MLSDLVRRLRLLLEQAVRAGSRPARRAAGWLRSGWAAHVSRVAADPGYAAAVSALLGGLLGLIPWRDVAAAVLAGVFGSRARGARGFDPFGPDAYPQD